MERIRSITEIENYGGDDRHLYSSGEDGFEVVTSQRTIRLLIDNGQSCCENWGYFLTEDDTSKFIGANLRSICVTDTALNARVLKRAGEMYEGGTMFVNLDTSRGRLQFVAYNEHNGYYGHTARIVSDNTTIHSDVL